MRVTDTGRVIRDHTPPSNEEFIDSPAPLPPEQRTMNSVITAEILRLVKPAVVSCGRQVPVNDRGDNARVMVTLTVDVTNQRLSSTEVHIAPAYVAESQRDMLANCIRDKLGTVTVAAPDEPERVGYVLQYPIRLR